MPDNQTTKFTLLPDGSRVVVPISSDLPASGQLLEVQGLVQCAYDNRAFDAAYMFPLGDSSRAQPHSYLSWQPYAPSLVEADIEAHRYVFRLPNLAAGVSPTVRVNIDQFVNEFLIPPSEVRGSLSGQFNLMVRPAAIAAPWPYATALTAVPALALVGGVAWVIRRRMAAATLDFDLEAQVARIHLAADAARRALGIRDARLVPVRGRLRALETGAAKLARQIQQIRGARKLHSPFALERDIAALEQRIAQPDRPAGAVRADLQSEAVRAAYKPCIEGANGASSMPSDAMVVEGVEASAQFAAPRDALSEELFLTLADKKRALASLNDVQRTEASLAARLDRVESTLDSTLAGLQAVKAGATAMPVSDGLCRSLDAEVSALREAARPLPENILLGRGGR